MKDVLGNKIEVGDVVMRPYFSQLSAHKVLKINKRGIVVSRYVAHFSNVHAYPILNNNIEEHNCILNIYFIPDLLIIEKNNTSLDVSKLKTLKEIEKDVQNSKTSQIQ